ncbi:hypothetical protein L345_06194, partial [Ophiophagus hannah]
MRNVSPFAFEHPGRNRKDKEKGKRGREQRRKEGKEEEKRRRKREGKRREGRREIIMRQILGHQQPCCLLPLSPPPDLSWWSSILSLRMLHYKAGSPHKHPGQGERAQQQWELAMPTTPTPTMAHPPWPPKVDHNLDVALNKIEFDTPDLGACALLRSAARRFNSRCTCPPPCPIFSLLQHFAGPWRGLFLASRVLLKARNGPCGDLVWPPHGLFWPAKAPQAGSLIFPAVWARFKHPVGHIQPACLEFDTPIWPTGHPGNKEGPAHDASASKNSSHRALPSSFFTGRGLQLGCHSQKQRLDAHFHWQNTQATTGAPDTNDVKLATPTLAMPPPSPRKIKHNPDAALNAIEFDIPGLT